MSLHFWSQPMQGAKQKSIDAFALNLDYKDGCNLHISVAYVKLVWSHYTWYNLSLDREGVKHSGTCMHACFIHAWMVWTRLYPMHYFMYLQKGIVCGQTTTASVTQNFCKQLNAWAANLVSIIILWTTHVKQELMAPSSLTFTIKPELCG